MTNFNSIVTNPVNLAIYVNHLHSTLIDTHFFIMYPLLLTQRFAGK